MRSDREIDDAIDRAVHEMMSAEPRAGLRGRVLGRLARSESAWLTLPRLAAAAALVVLAVMAFQVWRPARESVQPSTVATNPRLASTPHATEAASESGSSPQPQAAPRVAAPVFPRQGRVAAANVDDPATFGPEPGATGKTVSLDGVAAPAIVITSIVVEPLTISRIVIEPIPPPR